MAGTESLAGRALDVEVHGAEADVQRLRSLVAAQQPQDAASSVMNVRFRAPADPEEVASVIRLHFAAGPNAGTDSDVTRDAYIVLFDAAARGAVEAASHLAARCADRMRPVLVCDVSDDEAVAGPDSGSSDDAALVRAAACADLALSCQALVSYCALVAAAPRDGPPLAALCAACVDAVDFPRHTLWDGEALTPFARAALRRSFWMLDADGDGALGDRALAALGALLRLGDTTGGGGGSPRAAGAADSRPGAHAASAEGATEIRAFVCDIADRQVDAGADPDEVRATLMAPGGAVTLLGFFGMCHVLLSEARHAKLWLVLAAHGIDPATGLPYRTADIDEALARAAGGNAAGGSGATVPAVSLHLSPVGADFFARLHHATTTVAAAAGADAPFTPPATLRALFQFTPPCPWSGIAGLPDVEADAVALADWVRCWRYAATVDPAAVAVFARYWAFNDDLATLFAAWPTRRHRGPQGGAAPPQMPPAATFLVLGSASCGKSTLLRHLAAPWVNAASAAESAAAEAVAAGAGGSRAPTTVALVPVPVAAGELLLCLRELSAGEVDATLATDDVMDSVDGVVLCYDGSDAYSFGFVATVLPRLARRAALPILLVMCKADQPPEDQLGLVNGPEQACAAHRVPWPPAIVSAASRAKQLASGLTNEVDTLPAVLTALVADPSLLTRVAGASAPARAAAASGATGGALRLVKRVALLGAVGAGVITVAAICELRFGWLARAPVLRDAWASVARALPPRLLADGAAALHRLDDAVSRAIAACRNAVQGRPSPAAASAN